LTLPAKLEIISEKKYLLTIHEGKFHQVKRMILSVEKCVTYLKRVKFGPLSLDENLPLGSYRLLTSDEIELLKK
jgi:16S rRNA pseudouridine516 synthase